MTPYRPHPDITNVCLRATQVGDQIRVRVRQAGASGRPTRERNLRQRGARWLNDVGNAYAGRLDRYHPRDLDRLAGCLTRVESAVGITPPGLRRLRAEVARRLAMPATALAEMEAEAEIIAQVTRAVGRLRRRFRDRREATQIARRASPVELRQLATRHAQSLLSTAPPPLPNIDVRLRADLQTAIDKGIVLPRSVRDIIGEARRRGRSVPGDLIRLADIAIDPTDGPVPPVTVRRRPDRERSGAG
jgi:hypothetical protein